MSIRIYKQDPDRAYAGRVHHRAYPSAKKSIALQGHHPSTEYSWRESGSPFLRYFGNAQPWVVEVFLAVIKAQSDLADWSRPKLEERERQLDSEIARAFAETIRLTHAPDATATQRIDADHVLAELVEERMGVRLQIEKLKRGERGH